LTFIFYIDPGTAGTYDVFLRRGGISGYYCKGSVIRDMEDRYNNLLDDKRVGRLLLKLSLPAFFGMSVMTLYNVVDTIFIGHFVGPLGIAGLSIVFPLQILTMGVGQLIGMGGASLVSRSIGGGDKSRAELALGNAVTSSLVLAIAMTVIGLANPDFWLRLMGSSETILPYARDYIIIILIGKIFPIFGMSLNNLVRAEGNARIPMTAMILGAVLNIILDAVFIVWLDMGIKGAAWATVVSQMITATYILAYYFTGRSFLALHLKNLAVEWNILREIFKIGVASFARTLAGSISAVIANNLLVAFGGDFAVTVFGIINRVLMFAFLPGVAAGQGLQPILGYNYGARRYKTAMRVIRIAITGATALCIVVCAMLFFFPDLLIRVFTSDPDVIVIGSLAAKIVFCTMFLVGFIQIGSLVFQSIGKAVQSFITSISRTVLFLIPLLLILPRFWGLDGIWISFPIADVLTFSMTLLLLIPQVREFKRLHLKQKEAEVPAE
jgi:putative MATE family efflux protein